MGNGRRNPAAIRDPIRVARVLAKAGIPCPAVTLAARGLPRDGSWLKKPLHSGGGTGIEPLIDAASLTLESHYLQAAGQGPELLRPLHRNASARHAWSESRGNSLARRGALSAIEAVSGPGRRQPRLAARLGALGSVLSSTFGLTGWFGIDYVLNRGIPWPVEINPRYTASVEIHELFLGRSLLDDHHTRLRGHRSGRRPPSGLGLVLRDPFSAN